MLHFLLQRRFSFMSADSTKPIPIRLTEDLLAQIDEAARLSGKSKQEVMREALDYGLTFLKRSDFKVADAVIDTVLRKEAEALQAKAADRDIALLAEKGTGYTTKRKGSIDVRNAAAPLPTYLVQRKGYILEPLSPSS
jgi:predicted transcriptional regulator